MGTVEPQTPSNPDKANPEPGRAVAPHPEWASGRRILHVVLFLILTAPVVVWYLGSTPPSETIPNADSEIGEAASDFTVKLFDGSTFTLSRHLARDGRPVVMNFWASWCTPCREEMPAFDAVARTHPDVMVLGVAVQDTEPEARAFADEIGVSYMLGRDTTGAILDQYPIFGLPATWFITFDGILVAQSYGQLDTDRLEELIRLHLTD